MPARTIRSDGYRWANAAGIESTTLEDWSTLAKIAAKPSDIYIFGCGVTLK
jgi:hypothetical protein